MENYLKNSIKYYSRNDVEHNVTTEHNITKHDIIIDNLTKQEVTKPDNITKYNIEVLMGIVMILFVMFSSVYYNSDTYAIQTAKKAQSKKDGDVNMAVDEQRADSDGYTVVIDPGHGKTCGRPKKQVFQNAEKWASYGVMQGIIGMCIIC